MYAHAEPVNLTGRLMRLDLSVVPPRLRRQTDYNAAWNMRTLIMMARAGMLDLESEPPERLAHLESEAEAALELRNEEHWGRYFRQVLVRVKEGAHRNKEVSTTIISRSAQGPSRAAKAGEAMLDALLDGRVEVVNAPRPSLPQSRRGASVVVSKACGGCPQHRREGGAHTHYAEPAAVRDRAGRTDRRRGLAKPFSRT